MTLLATRPNNLLRDGRYADSPANDPVVPEADVRDGTVEVACSCGRRTSWVPVSQVGVAVPDCWCEWRESVIALHRRGYTAQQISTKLPVTYDQARRAIKLHTGA